MTWESTMIRFKLTIAGALLALLLAACAGMGGAPVKYSNDVMTNSAGMTLYSFDKDVGLSGKSVCNGACATNWPPFMAGASDQASGDWSIVTRDDGSRQWAYSGKPLYLWSKDQKPGDKTGDGFNNAWHAVKHERQAPMSGGY
jgi:predicted lipoprotein with Yx(FWY)xxD motif